MVNENDTVATDEIRFGDNDRLAALVAHVTRAGALILLSDVDGLYDGDPRRGEAQRITEVRGRADLDGIRLGRGHKAGQGSQGSQKAQGIGGMATKVDAAMIASAAGIPTVVADAASAAAALARRAGRDLLRRRPRPQAGHPAALAEARRGGPRQPAAGPRCGGGGRRQAAPACCRPASPGSREPSTPATRSTCRDEDGAIVARGLVNYDATEVPGLMGRSTRWLASKLGPEYEREVVHRDDMVISASPGTPTASHPEGGWPFERSRV